VLGGAFLLLAAVPVLTASVGAFLAVFGLSYFFVEFGPNMTTFVLPSEVFPVSARTTGHGISAGVGKLGAFLGVFLVPALQTRLGLRPMLAIAAVSAVIGIFLTRLLPEAARRNLDEVSGDNDKQDERRVLSDHASEQEGRRSLAEAG
jgi:PHS family inorganic phosphate transporter-like MFS transporter